MPSGLDFSVKWSSYVNPVVGCSMTIKSVRRTRSKLARIEINNLPSKRNVGQELGLAPVLPKGKESSNTLSIR